MLPQILQPFHIVRPLPLSHVAEAACRDTAVAWQVKATWRLLAQRPALDEVDVLRATRAIIWG